MFQIVVIIEYKNSVILETILMEKLLQEQKFVISVNKHLLINYLKDT